MDNSIALLQGYEQALDDARQSNDPKLIGNALCSLAQVYQELGETSRSIAYYEQALDLAREIGDRKAESATLGNLGTIYVSEGEISQAIESYQVALAIAREIGDKKAESATLGNLGTIYVSEGEISQAIESYQVALAIAREIGDRKAESTILGNLGNIHASQRDVTRAIEFYEQALAIAHEIGDRRAENATWDNLYTLKSGNVVEGTIVRIDHDEILIDIGLKFEGVLSTTALPMTGYGSLDELHLKDKIPVYIMQPETQDIGAVLSLKRAMEQQWLIAEKLYRNNELLTTRVIDYNEDGLIVNVHGIRAFVPLSQIIGFSQEEISSGNSEEIVSKLQAMKDRELQLIIIEISSSRDRLILSERLAVQESRHRRRDELLEELKPGEVRKGVISNIANFGAFVDLGGTDGLVHISQLSWSRVNHPSEVVHIGQEVDIQVLSVDKERKRIALSIKQTKVDPWKAIEQRYAVGQLVTGLVNKIEPVGAFAHIEDGIEGLIAQYELADSKLVLHAGMSLQLYITRIDPEHRRLELGFRQVDSLVPDKVNESQREPTNPIADHP